MNRKDYSTNFTINVIHRVHQGSLALSQTKALERSMALQAMAEAILQHKNEILEANTLDLEANRTIPISAPMVELLKLTPERLHTTVQILQQLSDLPDLVGQVVGTSYQLEHSKIYGQRIPLGIIALIYEAFPELVAIAAGMCIQTANSLIIRGGSEARNSNLVITKVLQLGLEQAGLPVECIEFLPPKDNNSIQELLTQDRYINLVIPYGRDSLVEQVVKIATVPVLKTAMGNCYLYWSASGSLDMVRWMILDSHKSQPDPVNAIEKVLIDSKHNLSMVVRLWNSLKENGFEVRGDAALVEEFPELVVTDDGEWNQAYLSKIVAFKIVDCIDSGIRWINNYSSGHADSLATESYQESRKFALGINSTCTFINKSPRFSRCQNQKNGIFLGMSNQKCFAQGLIGLEAFTRIKYIVQGNL
ncbi:MAG: glutamate-5-semialdehyde dehydrogenase [Trichodesmium sp. St15_bin1_1]|nr:glutamate-5-semialdehyde dehydrogenase [Trichodesmium sp. St5_bin2_1]MDE5114813.1 glutamate-5-semialdehyde dehydrogenase [Trichodesmium sp. St15_bin1_1]